MIIVGIGFEKRAGKDTFAEFLCREFSPGSATVSFAAELKKECATATGVSVETMEEHKTVFRPLLQWWGTEFRREFGKDNSYWVDRLDEKINGYRLSGFELVCITDVRFPNEVDYVKSVGGQLIRVTRPGLVSSDTHKSENALRDFDGWDYVVNNDAGLDDLETKAEEIAELFRASAVVL